MESGAHKPFAKKSLAASMQRIAQYSEIPLLGGVEFLSYIYHDGNLHRYQGNQLTFSAGTTNRKKDEFGKQFSFSVTASESISIKPCTTLTPFRHTYYTF